MPPSMFFTVDVLRGHYWMEYPRGQDYYDFRGGLWYAFSR
jgi:hypothetical protein